MPGPCLSEGAIVESVRFPAGFVELEGELIYSEEDVPSAADHPSASRWTFLSRTRGVADRYCRGLPGRSAEVSRMTIAPEGLLRQEEIDRDQRLCELLALHFHPRHGSQYWLRRQERLGWPVCVGGYVVTKTCGCWVQVPSRTYGASRCVTSSRKPSTTSCFASFSARHLEPPAGPEPPPIAPTSSRRPL
jgi:hypothetical protein